MGMRGSLALALLLSLMAAGSASAQTAGRFIVVVGDVKVLGRDGAERTAARDGEFQQGESIVTGRNSLAQIRMGDGAAMSIRAESQLKLDAFKYTEGGGSDDSFVLSVLRGGLRTITGLIARARPTDFRITTPTLTIGVRGTDFEVVHVLQQLAADAPAGTYNRVYDGVTTVQNQAGPIALVSRDQTAFVPLAGNAPPVLVTPPASLFGKPTPALPVDPRLQPVPGGRSGDKPPALKVAPDRVIAPVPTERAGTPLLLNPIDTPRIVAPTTTEPLRTISPTLTSPTTTTISPTLTAPATTTISPTLTSPTTTTISPTLTAPTTTTISPTLTSPTTTTISPILTAPTTTTISPTLTSPTTTTISPILTAPTTTTISPTLTAPTTTISPAPSTTTISPTTTTIIKR
jgi:hypothetical protein